MIADSGNRTEFNNGFRRDLTEGKGRMDLLPMEAIRQVSIHCEEGAKKYGERNIDKGAPQWSLYSSAMRHLSKAIEPPVNDPETTLIHLRAAAWNCLWALQQYVNEINETDPIEPTVSEPIEAVAEPVKAESKPVEVKQKKKPGPKPKREGEPKPKKDYSHLAKPKDLGKVKALYNAGWSVIKMADEFNVSTGTMYRWIKEIREDD